jgi:TolB-like protein/cytochrome c-type biogenesis protein CcmH/NrfG
MNLSGDPAQDYFADGLTDELITMIAKNPTLRVVSRTSAMQYQGVHRPLREIGRELGVDGVLEGSVTRAGNRVHMTVQLVHVESDTDVWAETYERDFADALSLPTELAQTIAVAVKSATGPAEVRPPVNPEAHDLYLRGLYFWFGDDLEKSIEYFQRAIRLAPDYAAAWSGLADAYIVQAVAVTVPVSRVEAKVREAAHKAVTLDDALSEAHRTLSAVHLFLDWNWEGAEAESERAIALNPGGAEARHLHSYVLLAQNRVPESLEEQKRSTELDPFARRWALGFALIHARQFDAAVAELRMRAEVQPQDASLRFMLSDAYRYLGRGKESAQAMEDAFVAAGQKARAEGARRAFDSGGEKGLSEWLLAEGKAAARTRYVSPWTLAERSARLHRTEETLRFLEAAYAERSPRLVYLKVEPDFDFLHADDRYRALVRKVGLP